MKKISLLLAISLVATSLLTACGKTEEPTAASTPTQESSITNNTVDDGSAPQSNSESAPANDSKADDTKDWNKAYDNFFKDYKFFDDGVTLDLYTVDYNGKANVRMLMSTLGEDTRMTMEMMGNDGASSGFTVCKVGDYSYLYYDATSQMPEGGNPDEYIIWVKTVNDEDTSSIGTFDKDNFGLDEEVAIEATYDGEETIDGVVYDVLKYIEARADITDENADSDPIIQYYYINRETQKLDKVESLTQNSSTTIHFTSISKIEYPANIEEAKEVTSEEYAMDAFVALLSMASGSMDSDDDDDFNWDWDIDDDFDWDSDWDVTGDSDLDFDWDIDWDEDLNFTIEDVE